MSETLDRFMPVYGARSVHGVRIAAPPEQVWAAMLQVTPADLPIARALMAIRTLPTRLRGGTSIMDSPLPLAELFRRDQRWVTLAEEPGRSLVAGRVARFWQLVPEESALRRPEDFMTFDEAGFARAVVSHEVVPDGSGSRLVTETRVQGTDARARRLFGAYWLVIRPGVGLVRRSVLNAVRRRCEGAGRTPG
jgi:hypothetical protein